MFFFFPAPVQEISVVLVGQFDYRDFERQSLVTREILTPEEAQSAYIIKRPGEEGYRFDAIDVLVAPRRLRLQTNDVSRADRMRDFALGILHHSLGAPSVACGINYELFLIVQDDQARAQILSRQASPSPKWSGILENPTVRDLTLTSRREGSFPGENNITICARKRQSAGIMITVNFPMPPECTPEEMPKLASRFLEEEWSAVDACARRAAENLLKEGEIHVL